MAPFKRVTKKELSLQRKPWITHGILNSMKIRDRIYKEYASEKDETKKRELCTLFKEYRNKIVALLRISKKKHFADYFKEHNSNIKKNMGRYQKSY